jgi:hypothetical protein
MIRESLLNASHKGGVSPSTTPWYLSESVWNFLLESLNFLADLFRKSNKPLVSIALDTVVSAANSKTDYVGKHEVLLRKKLNALSQALAQVERDTVQFFRIDAQLELLGELMENGCANG